MDTSNLLTLFEQVKEWALGLNYILVIIVLCSVIATAVFFERIVYLKKANIDTAALLVRLREAISDGHIAEAMHACEQVPGACAHIIKAGLCKHDQTREHIENAMQIRGLIEIAQMERNTRILSIIASIAPLIGLLGTVVGFIRAFAEMRMSSLVEISASQIGQALEYALVTTAAGLVVAIPSVIAYNYIISKIESMTVHIQATSSEVVDLIVQEQGKHL